MIINDRIAQLREMMYERGIDIYIVPTSDYHDSEYVGDFFKLREYITGFTGSAGTAVITMDEANLWTDARYFLQAEAELKGSEVVLRKEGEEGVPSINEYLQQKLSENGTIGFDGRVVSFLTGLQLEKIADSLNGSLHTDEDLAGLLWHDRPALPTEPVMILDEKYSGESVADKLKKIREAMAEQGASVHLLTSLYDIAWLLNIRGNDIAYVPVVLSYMALTMSECILYVQDSIITPELSDYFEQNNITVKPYDSFYEYVSELPVTETILMDNSVVNYKTAKSIDSNIKVISAANPSTIMKAVKNDTELKNTISAHLKDGIAMCKFMYWLKNNIEKIPMTEISVSDYLEELRKMQEGFIELSFETISGYNEHGAIVHYTATPETDATLKPEGLLLVDSGGHYLEGTTDITRTFALGPVSDEMRRDFTNVCRSNLQLANAKFLYGCTGMNLDILAREPLWENMLDYKHGTGHGVGHILNVHEGPNGFRWRQSPTRSEGSILEAGMITTDEPGLYIEEKYGIRTENELICRKGIKNEYGQFMYFEPITYVPIDLDALDPDLMSPREKKWLNDYHSLVYEKIAPHLADDEREWLKIYTRAI